MTMNIFSAAAMLQAAEGTAAQAPGIGTGALIFMLSCMAAVTALTIWCFKQVLATKRHFDPDGTGPAEPPVEGAADPRSRA